MYTVLANPTCLLWNSELYVKALMSISRSEQTRHASTQPHTYICREFHALSKHAMPAHSLTLTSAVSFTLWANTPCQHTASLTSAVSFTLWANTPCQHTASLTSAVSFTLSKHAMPAHSLTYICREFHALSKHAMPAHSLTLTSAVSFRSTRMSSMLTKSMPRFKRTIQCLTSSMRPEGKGMQPV